MTEQLEREYAELRSQLTILQRKLESLHEGQAGRDRARAPGRSRLLRRVAIGVMALAAPLAVGGVLYGQGVGDALFIDQQGRVGVGTRSSGAALDVVGQPDKDGQISLQLRSGNSGGNFASNQITLGYANTDTYRHAIKSRHHGGQIKGNAIDFYVWNWGDGKSDKALIGGLHTMTLDGGRVGVGTPDPQEKLHVAGPVLAEGFRTAAGVSLAGVQDGVKMLVPIGTIMAYGGDTGNPAVVAQLGKQGWLPCNGAAVSRQDYADLFAAIGTAFGADAQTFRVPDLRGRFLRGTDQGQKRDPDAEGRRADAAGGNSGDRVGSVQEDEFKRHTHGYEKFPGREAPNIAGGSYWVSAQAQTSPAGGNETRPKNVNVNWIIKAKHLPAA
jgi:microcystin-dependent protein